MIKRVAFALFGLALSVGGACAQGTFPGLNPTFNGAVTVSGSANSVFLQGASTGNAPSISAIGSDTNIGLTLADKGNGSILLQTNSATAVTIDGNRHVSYTTGTPTASACAGFALSTGSSDTAGRVTFTSATSCAISFGTAFTNAPFCQVTAGSAAATTEATTSTTVLTATFGTAQTAMFYQCFGT